MKWIIRLLGLRGSWKWACRQLMKGHVVYPLRATGAVQYALDDEHQKRLLWRFGNNDEWQNANFFLRDQLRTDWVVMTPRTHHPAADQGEGSE